MQFNLTKMCLYMYCWQAVINDTHRLHIQRWQDTGQSVSVEHGSTISSFLLLLFCAVSWLTAHDCKMHKSLVCVFSLASQQTPLVQHIWQGIHVSLVCVVVQQKSLPEVVLRIYFQKIYKKCFHTPVERDMYSGESHKNPFEFQTTL